MRILTAAIFSTIFIASGLCLADEEPKVTGSAGLGIFNRYVFRGYELSGRSVILQPNLGIAYRGFSLSLLGNIDSDEQATQSFNPDRPGHASFNERDITLSYTHNIGKFGLTGGYIFYSTDYAPATQELFVSASYDIIAKPTISVYRDVAKFPGTYVNLSFSQSFKVHREITLDLGASAGYFAGDGGYWRTFDASTGGYTGKKYRAFHDGMASAGITFPVTNFIAVQPVVQYWFPLSSKARRMVDGNSYNPNGHLDDTWVTGMNVKISF